MTDSTSPAAAVDDVDQAPPIMRVVAHADGTISIRMSPADAESVAHTISDHLERLAFGMSVRRVATGQRAQQEIGSLRWSQLVTDLLAAKAELVDRVDVAPMFRFGATVYPERSKAWPLIEMPPRGAVDIDITAATTPRPPTDYAQQTIVDCPGQCGRQIRAGRYLCPSCWARVPQDLVALFRRRLNEGHSGGWEDNHIRNFEAAKRAVFDAALGAPVAANTEEPPC